MFNADGCLHLRSDGLAVCKYMHVGVWCIHVGVWYMHTCMDGWANLCICTYIYVAWVCVYDLVCVWYMHTYMNVQLGLFVSVRACLYMCFSCM